MLQPIGIGQPDALWIEIEARDAGVVEIEPEAVFGLLAQQLSQNAVVEAAVTDDRHPIVGAAVPLDQIAHESACAR